jgi:hypothetical protein
VKDYTLLEAELLAHYQPQNQYCFSVDSKAPERFWHFLELFSAFFSTVYSTVFAIFRTGKSGPCK